MAIGDIFRYGSQHSSSQIHPWQAQRSIAIRAASYLYHEKSEMKSISWSSSATTEPIYFDSTNGFMPAEKLVQEGIILMISRSSHRFIAREGRETFYQQNSFTLKSSDIPLLLDSEPFKHLEEGGFDPKEWIRRLAVYLDSEKVNPQCHPQNDPNSYLRSIPGCTDLREVKVVIRGPHQATDAFCKKVIKIRWKPASSSK